MVAHAHAFDYDAFDYLCFACLEGVVQLVAPLHEPAFRRPFHGVHKSDWIACPSVAEEQQGSEDIL